MFLCLDLRHALCEISFLCMYVDVRKVERPLVKIFLIYLHFNN